MKHEDIRETVGTQVVRIDRYLSERGIDRVDLLKIDTEGFEYPVLKGFEGFLERTGLRPPILCEIAPRAYPLLGLRLKDLDTWLQARGYRACHLLDSKRRIDLVSLKETTDVLFVAG